MEGYHPLDATPGEAMNVTTDSKISSGSSGVSGPTGNEVASGSARQPADETHHPAPTLARQGEAGVTTGLPSNDLVSRLRSGRFIEESIHDDCLDLHPSHALADALEAKDAEIERLGRDRDRIMQAFTHERELHMTTIAERDRLLANAVRLGRELVEFQRSLTIADGEIEELRERIESEPQRYAAMTAQFRSQAEASIECNRLQAEVERLTRELAEARSGLAGTERDNADWAEDNRRLSASNAALREALASACDYIEADSSERFAELTEWRALAGAQQGPE